ncbi:MAG: cytochrome c-type biogenesis protein CcmH [Caldilineaceae bacterium]|nr:cytochrome c-type biogenesis protein CcmH [Caldilineaceae bacterium]
MVQKRTEGNKWRRWWVGALILGLLWVISSGVVLAQGDAPAVPVETSQEVTPDQVNVVARELWCPLCSGVRLDACELKACDQMKEVIALKLAEGEDTETIKAYFVEQYGPQVMGEPPRQGFNWLAWILPAVAVVVGGLFFWRATQRMMKRPVPAPAESPVVRTITTADDDDEYTQKLDEELAKYG